MGHRSPARRPFARLLPVIGLLPIAMVLTACDPPTSTLQRPIDPVVTTGADVPLLVGATPGDIVGFRWVKDVGWEQVPVQVDERRDADVGVLYHGAANNVIIKVYADAGTWAGADPDPTFDVDDEIAVMARDTGGFPPAFSEPAGVVAGSGSDLRITDPTVLNTVGHVYLFRRNGALDPGAGQHYVNYSFSLNSGAYKTTYKYSAGPNPENSTVSGAAYSKHFADRWAEDQLKVTAGGATGVDILDRHKALFAPGYCGRHEDTFDAGEGAFTTNKNGPVRAIRGYIGANSGPNTMRQHVFYDQREDIVTDLRVHAIPGIMDFYDYSPAAVGMAYSNSNNPNGVLIDGVPEAIAGGAATWEKVDGAQGAVVIGSLLDTDTGVGATTYWEDNKTNPTTQCTGDAAAYGSSGPWLNSSIACTDPGNGCTAHLRATRVLSYVAPGVTAENAALRATQATTPLVVTTHQWGS